MGPVVSTAQQRREAELRALREALVDGASPESLRNYCRAMYGKVPAWAEPLVLGARSRERRKRRAGRRRRGRQIKSYRKNISVAKRLRVYERDGYRCVTCGTEDRDVLTLDHRIPISKGGTNEETNLQTMCRQCNCAKGLRMPAGQAA